MSVSNLFATVVSPDIAERRLCRVWAEQCAAARAGIFRDWLCLCRAQAASRSKTWELAALCEEPPASSRLLGCALALALCPSICFLLLGLGPRRESVPVGKGISELLSEHRGAVYQICETAGLPSPSAVPAGWWKGEQGTTGMSPSYGRYWEQGAKWRRRPSP